MKFQFPFVLILLLGCKPKATDKNHIKEDGTEQALLLTSDSNRESEETLKQVANIQEMVRVLQTTVLLHTTSWSCIDTFPDYIKYQTCCQLSCGMYAHYSFDQQGRIIAYHYISSGSMGDYAFEYGANDKLTGIRHYQDKYIITYNDKSEITQIRKMKLQSVE